MKGNVIVGQSGGPTAAINSSLAGVYRTAKDRGAKKVFGMLHGIQGLLQERYIDMADFIKTELDAELLKRTPAAFLGSCRYKLPEIHENMDVYDKIFQILDKLEIEAFIYIGGNDSMDTIKKLSDYAIVTGHPTRFVGCPKTIDNDLALTDHKRRQIYRHICERDHPRQLLPGIRKGTRIYCRDHGTQCRLADRRFCACKRRGLRRARPDLSSGAAF